MKGRRAGDSDPGHVAQTLAAEICSVNFPVQAASGPKIEVKDQSRGRGLEVVLDKVGLDLLGEDGEALVAFVDDDVIPEPEDVAQGRALDLAEEGKVGGVGQRPGDRTQTGDEIWRS